MSFLNDIPIVGNILGGGGGGDGGILGGLLDMTGLPQLIEEAVLLYVGLMVGMKLLDKL